MTLKQAFCNKTTEIARKLYKFRIPIATCATVFTVLCCVSGFPAFIILFLNHNAIVDGKPKLVMLSGIVYFVYFMGFLGLYFWTRTDYEHYRILWFVGTALILGSALAVQWLWNFGNS